MTSNGNGQMPATVQIKRRQLPAELVKAIELTRASAGPARSAWWAVVVNAAYRGLVADGMIEVRIDNASSASDII